MENRKEHKPGEMIPVVNRSRCEAKGPCVTACPYDVLVINPITAGEKRLLPLLARLRVAMHGNKQAYVVQPEACTGCGLCVEACPERAITLRRNTNA